MTETVGEFARRAALLPAVLVETTPKAVHASGEILEAAARANVAAATGGDMVLSRVRSGRRSAGGGTPGLIRLDLRTVGTGSGTRAQVIPRGPLMLVEGDTRAHREPFRYLAERTGGARSYSMGRRRAAVRSRVIRIPGRGVFASVEHRGTRGKHPVRNAFRDHADEAGRRGALVFAGAARRHLGR